MQKISTIHLHTISLSGSDAADFLNRMLCNDVSLLQEGHGQFTALCTPKGRVIANGFLLKVDDAFQWVISSDLIDIVAQRLTMFVMRSNVSISIQNDQQWELSQSNGSHPIQLGDERYFARLCEPQTNVVNFFAIQQIPLITLATTEKFVPQMLNMDKLSGLNYKKGCYPGQEIVARMHFLGKLKQRTFSCKWDDQALEDGSNLYETTDNKQLLAGSLLFSSNSKSRYTGLCCVRIKETEHWILTNETSVQIDVRSQEFTT